MYGSVSIAARRIEDTLHKKRRGCNCIAERIAERECVITTRGLRRTRNNTAPLVPIDRSSCLIRDAAITVCLCVCVCVCVCVCMCVLCVCVLVCVCCAKNNKSKNRNIIFKKLSE